MLAGVISSHTGITGNIQYIAYCHHPRGSSWTKHNNSLKKTYVAGDTTSVRVALIVYVLFYDLQKKDSSSSSKQVIQPVEDQKPEEKTLGNQDSNYNGSLCVLAESSQNEFSNEHLTFNSTEFISSSFPNIVNISDEHNYSKTSLHLHSNSIMHVESFNFKNYENQDSTLVTENKMQLQNLNIIDMKDRLGKVLKTKNKKQNANEKITYCGLQKPYKLLRNGNRLAQNIVGETSFKYEETSRFDCLVEIFVRMCDSHPEFKQFCLNNF